MFLGCLGQKNDAKLTGCYICSLLLKSSFKNCKQSIALIDDCLKILPNDIDIAYGKNFKSIYS